MGEGRQVRRNPRRNGESRRGRPPAFRRRHMTAPASGKPKASCVVTLGELMLRLKSPGFERLFQSPMLEATFGGAEANVAVSLAQFGVAARFVSAIPANNIGDAGVAELRRHGVDTSFVKRQGERLGIYFLESGANQRPSKVTYDRARAAI